MPSGPSKTVTRVISPQDGLKCRCPDLRVSQCGREIGHLPAVDLRELGVQANRGRCRGGRHRVDLHEAGFHRLQAILQARRPQPLGNRVIEAFELAADRGPLAGQPAAVCSLRTALEVHFRSIGRNEG